MMEYYNKMMYYIGQEKDELKDAKKYTKMAMRCKESGNMTDAKLYYDMAGQELHHADNIHGMGVRYMNGWKAKETIPEWITDKWNEADGDYFEHVGKVKYMMAEFTK